jgi:peptide/nickel transport system substrate-binding protein
LDFIETVNGHGPYFLNSFKFDNSGGMMMKEIMGKNMCKRVFLKTGFLLVFAAVFLSACGGKGTSQRGVSSNAAAETGEKILPLATSYTWMQLCPYTFSTKDAQAVFSFPAFETVVSYTSSGKLEPRILKSWEQSEDGKVITCKVQENAFFHDGKPITAADVVFSFELFADPAGDNEKVCSNIAGTDNTGNWITKEGFGVKEIDPLTVQFTLKQPLSVLAFFYLMKSPVVLPKHLLEGKNAATLKSDPFWEHPVGSGAFKVDNYVTGERMEYVAFDDFFLGRPKFDRLIIRTMPPASILSAMLSGEVDMVAYASQMSYSDFEMAENEPGLTTLKITGFSNDHMLINNEKHNERIRLAFDYAIDRDALIEACLKGYGVRSISDIYPDSPFRNPNVKSNPYDPEKARQLLAQEKWNSNYEMLCYVQADQAIRVQAAEMIQQMFAAVGIKMQIQQADMGTISAALFAGNHDVAVMGSASTPFEPDNAQFYFRSIPNGWNRMAEGNEFITLFLKGLESVNIEERKPYYYELQEKLVQKVPMAFLFHKDNLYVHNKRVKNVPFEDFALKNWKYWEWVIE